MSDPSTDPPSAPSSDAPVPAPVGSVVLAWLREFARLWLFLLFFLLVFIAFRAIVLPFILGGILAYVLLPPVRLCERKLPRVLAVLVVYVGILATLALVGFTLVPRLSGDFARLFREVPHFLTRVRTEWVPRADAWLEETLPQQVDGSAEDLEPRPERKLVVTERAKGKYDVSLEGMELELDPAGNGRYVVGPRSDADEKRPRLGDMLAHAAQATQTELKDVVAVGRRFVGSAFRVLAWFVLTFMVAAYALLDRERVLAFIERLVPPRHRAGMQLLFADIDRGLSGAIRGQLTICLINSAFTAVGLLMFHVKYPFVLSLVAGALSFIPVFGSIVSSVPVVAVALVSGPGGAFSLGKGAEVLLWVVLIHLVEANLLNPRIIGGATKIHPVVVVFALLMGEQMAGLLGALLAVPVASMVQSLVVFLLNPPHAPDVDA